MSSNKVLFKRSQKIDLPEGQSCFLWGARQTGKSTYLRNLFPNSIRYDLLESDLFLSLLKEPQRLREELLQTDSVGPVAKKNPIIIDEIQKVPVLLDDVHWLIENKNLSFILCGSSARKLKRGHANLLGGRAWRYEMYPLSFSEIPKFDLMTALERGLLPRHYQDAHYKKSLKAYVNDYLKEEIRAEGLTRNLPAFSKFLDVVAYTNNELIVYKNIASDVGVDSKTVKEYFDILVDTHLGYLVRPLVSKKGRKTIEATSKFYLFDPGVTNHLAKTNIQTLRGPIAGKRFEQWILMELLAYRSYQEKDFEINFWKTKTGQEVDFVINQNEIYIEATISDNIKASDIRGLKALVEERKPKRAIVVCTEKRSRQLAEKVNGTKIEVLNWKDLMAQLWAGELIQ